LGAIEHRVALYTTPVVLAAGGAATSVEVVIPADIAVGRHTLVVWVLVDGDVQISGLVVDVVAALTPGELPATGASPMPTTSIALVLLLLGAVIVVSTRRRRI